ncbi:C40 family peptidase [Pediococcus argentinicus]|uniref:NlpC/P60 domain-containing protein n=2 Tax=Pediococcus argentinicus TaxID=480391 RepID=A0A0R2NJQ2_9LACO|nr:hypothetical protein IV88_GL000928 [Pediococcus argentinicus]GEP18837.1 hypothetical protein LSA03_02210 [Pediococcus argentinicus]
MNIIINFKKVLVASVGLVGMTLGTVGAVSANAANAPQQSAPVAEQTQSFAQPQLQPTANTNKTAVATPVSTKAESSNGVVAEALKLASMNIPYVWGGESLSGMDCSGLTDYVYQKATGKSLGHFTVTQESKVTKESVSDAQPGDLLFWGSEGSTYHVAIYIGGGQFVAAPQPGENVKVQSLSSGFAPSFAGHVN